MTEISEFYRINFLRKKEYLMIKIYSMVLMCTFLNRLKSLLDGRNEYKICDSNLTPGIFFPNADSQGLGNLQNSSCSLNMGTSQKDSAISPQNNNIPNYTNNQQSINYGNGIAPISSFPSAQSSSTMPTNISYPNQGSFNGFTSPSQAYYPQNFNNFSNQLAPYTTQPPNNNALVSPCDNSAERDQYKKCVADSLKSLRSILENCRKNLGENAKECNINMDCLLSLKKEGKDNEVNDKTKTNGQSTYRDNQDKLDEFIDFLEMKLQRKANKKRENDRNPRKKRNRFDDDEESEDYDYWKRNRPRNYRDEERRNMDGNYRKNKNRQPENDSVSLNRNDPSKNSKNNTCKDRCEDYSEPELCKDYFGCD